MTCLHWGAYLYCVSAGTFVVASTAVGDELPGWSDLPELARVSIIGFMCLLIACVVAALWLQNRWMTKEFVEYLTSRQEADAETAKLHVANLAEARTAFTESIDKICARAEDNNRQAHDDLRENTKALGLLTERISRCPTNTT